MTDHPNEDWGNNPAVQAAEEVLRNVDVETICNFSSPNELYDCLEQLYLDFDEPTTMVLASLEGDGIGIIRAFLNEETDIEGFEVYLPEMSFSVVREGDRYVLAGWDPENLEVTQQVALAHVDDTYREYLENNFQILIPPLREID